MNGIGWIFFVKNPSNPIHPKKSKFLKILFDFHVPKVDFFYKKPIFEVVLRGQIVQNYDQ
jgi:hypothetical protein